MMKGRLSRLCGAAVLSSAALVHGQERTGPPVLPDAPSVTIAAQAEGQALPENGAGAWQNRPQLIAGVIEAAAPAGWSSSVREASFGQEVQDGRPRSASGDDPQRPAGPLGPDGRPIRPQTGRIFGIFPNFVAISGGTKPKPAGWKTDFVLANKQNYDYSAFGFLVISSALAYGENSHPAFNTYHGGDSVFWAYLWRGFVDKTDAVYQGTFFFPALLHEDTRYYALGTGSPKKRLTHALLSVVVAHDYDQKPIFNLAGQLGRVGTQAVSTTYYPPGSEGFGVLAEKYAYSNLRSMIYAVVREYSPEAQAVVAHRRQRRTAEKAAKDQ